MNQQAESSIVDLESKTPKKSNNVYFLHPFPISSSVHPKGDRIAQMALTAKCDNVENLFQHYQSF